MLVAILNFVYFPSLDLGAAQACRLDNEIRKIASLCSSMIKTAEKKFLANKASCFQELASRREFVSQNQTRLTVCRNLLKTASPEDLQNSETNVGGRYQNMECDTLLTYSDSLISLNNECSFLRDADYAKKVPMQPKDKAKYTANPERAPAQSLDERRKFVSEKCGGVLGKNMRSSTVGSIDAAAKMRLTKGKIEGLINSQEGFSAFRSQLDSASGDDAQIERICLQYAADDVI